jgi:hypothetical protein
LRRQDSVNRLAEKNFFHTRRFSAASVRIFVEARPETSAVPSTIVMPSRTTAIPD